MITKLHLDAIEKFADKLWAKVGLDVEFTRHFLDRVNDARNKKQITAGEVQRLFRQSYKKHGKKIANLGKDAEAVIKDMQTDINMPFVLQLDKKGELDLVAKTVMRKKNFRTSNQTFAIEGFKSQLDEASVKGKNTHMTHIEDRVLYGGVKGAREAIFALRGMRDMLAGKESKTTDATVKWDGAPAVFAGIDPSDGKFFVAKKGIFNKNPKVYKTNADVDADTSGDLASKLKVALSELSKLGIKNVVQGDLLFTDDVSTDTIDGQKYYTFQPNTIVYAVPVNSDLGRKINKAKIGIIFHTTYTGPNFEAMKASYKVDTASFKTSDSIFFDDAGLKDISGTLLSQAETDEVTAALSKAGKIFQKIQGSTLREIEKDPTLAQEIETFNNTYVRAGEKIGDSKKHVSNLLKWYAQRYQKEQDKRKSQAGKDKIQQKAFDRAKFFGTTNKKNLELVFELQKQLVVAKELIISKLDKVKKMNTFVRTKQGFKVTGQEGFVAIDKIGGGAIKLVDRLEFSYNNFSKDVIKGWEK